MDVFELRHQFIGDRAHAVLDTKYKDHATPRLDDMQQVVCYAHVLGCHSAYLVYPRPVPSFDHLAGGVRVRTLGLDLFRPLAIPWALGQLGESGAVRQ